MLHRREVFRRLLSAVMCRNSGELHLVSFRVDEKQVVPLFFYTAGVKSRGFCVHLQFKRRKENNIDGF